MFATRLAAALAFASFCLMSAPSHAECKDIVAFIHVETAGPDKFVDTFSFRKDHRGDTLLMLVKDTIEKGHLPKRWLLLKRAPTGADFCVVSRGTEVGQHDDEPQKIYSDKFGPPGSGHQQCAVTNAQAAAPTRLRAWANSELPGAIVLYTVSPDGPGYQFVIGTERDWIIIEDRKEVPAKSCFYDRGTDVMMRFNKTTITQ